MNNKVENDTEFLQSDDTHIQTTVTLVLDAYFIAQTVA